MDYKINVLSQAVPSTASAPMTVRDVVLNMIEVSLLKSSRPPHMVAHTSHNTHTTKVTRINN